MTTNSHHTTHQTVWTLALVLALALAGCGDDNSNTNDSNNGAPNTGKRSPNCGVLLEETLVPFGAGETVLVFEFDYPEGWTSERRVLEEVEEVLFYRSVTGGRGNDVHYSIIQYKEPSESRYEQYKSQMNYQHITNLDFGGQTVEVIGRESAADSQLWLYAAWLPTPGNSSEFVSLHITTVQGVSGNICKSERKELLDAIVQTIRPNPQTTFGQGD